ncbi:hypothetical protein Tco_0143967 [Tanacetum coccineum]
MKVLQRPSIHRKTLSEEEVAEAMGEPTMEEYMTITRTNYESGNEKGGIELKGTIRLWMNTPRMLYGIIREEEMMKRIDTDLFNFDTPLCQTFKEFNYLSQINIDTDDEAWNEPIDNIYHECNPIRFINGTAKWPTCNWKEDGYCNIGNLPGFIREGNSIRYEDYEWYDTIEDSKLKEESLINKRIVEESMNAMEESSDDKWDHDSPVDEWKDYVSLKILSRTWNLGLSSLYVVIG